MTRRAGYLSLWMPVAAGMAALYFLSGQSEVDVPGGLSDKAAHLLAYAGLGLLVVRAVAGGLPARITGRMAAMSLAIAVAYGASDEVHQMFVPGRMPDAADVIADASGALLAVAACWAWGIIQLPTPESHTPNPKPQ
jgi:VanZ family protein